MNDPEHPALRELLRNELNIDESRAPEFDAVWSAAAGRSRRQRTHSALLRLGALAAVIVLALVAVRAFRPVRNPHAVATADLPWRSTVLLTEWRAPTDVLLPVIEFVPLRP